MVNPLNVIKIAGPAWQVVATAKKALPILKEERSKRAVLVNGKGNKAYDKCPTFLDYLWIKRSSSIDFMIFVKKKGK